MTPEDARHGSEAGHEQHLRDNETPCEPCYDAKIKAARRRTKLKTMGYRYTLPLGAANHQKIRDAYELGGTHASIGAWFGLCESEVWRYLHGAPEQTVYARTWKRINSTPPFPRPVTAIGVTRRIQALLWLGHSPRTIADRAGVHLDTIRDARDAPRQFLAERVREGVARAYAELSMTLPDARDRYARASATRVRGGARKAGYLPPLAWDAIDDPGEVPAGPWRPVHARPAAELLAEWDHLRSLGVSLARAAEQLGVTVDAIEKAIARRAAA
jgi:hypothetical protein